MDICEEVHLKVDYQPGDIGLVNNHQILHGRADYEDWPEVGRRRYLLRLWLSPEDGRPCRRLTRSDTGMWCQDNAVELLS